MSSDELPQGRPGFFLGRPSRIMNPMIRVVSRRLTRKFGNFALDSAPDYEYSFAAACGRPAECGARISGDHRTRSRNCQRA